MSMSNYLENKILDHALKNTVYTSPSTVYLALFTTDPTEDGTGTEVSGNAYVRKAITFGSAVGGISTNSADVLFDVATGSWGTVSHVAIYDAVSNGNMLYYGALGTPQTISVNNQIIFRAGQLTVTLD